MPTTYYVGTEFSGGPPFGSPDFHGCLWEVKDNSTSNFVFTPPTPGSRRALFTAPIDDPGINGSGGTLDFTVRFDAGAVGNQDLQVYAYRINSGIEQESVLLGSLSIVDTINWLTFSEDISALGPWGAGDYLGVGFILNENRTSGTPANFQFNIGNTPDVVIAPWSESSGVNLEIQNVFQSQTIENLTVTQKHILELEDLNQSQSIGNLDLTQKHNIDVQDLAQPQTLSNMDLFQNHTIIIQDIDQPQSISNLDLTQPQNLTIQNASQTQFIENLILTQSHVLELEGLVQSQAIDNMVLTQKHNLEVQGLTQVQVLDKALFGSDLYKERWGRLFL